VQSCNLEGTNATNHGACEAWPETRALPETNLAPACCGHALLSADRIAFNGLERRFAMQQVEPKHRGLEQLHWTGLDQRAQLSGQGPSPLS